MYNFNYLFRLKIPQIKNIDKNTNNIIPIEWYLLLLNEGSFTQNLNYITGQQITIQIKQKICHNIQYQKIKSIRCIWLANNIYSKLTFARSLWTFMYHDEIYKKIEINEPIGKLLVKSRSDIYRNLTEIYYGYCKYLEKKFNINQGIWGRKYVLHYNNNTYAIVQEFFSPSIINLFHNQ